MNPAVANHFTLSTITQPPPRCPRTKAITTLCAPSSSTELVRLTPTTSTGAPSRLPAHSLDCCVGIQRQRRPPAPAAASLRIRTQRLGLANDGVAEFQLLRHAMGACYRHCPIDTKAATRISTLLCQFEHAVQRHMRRRIFFRTGLSALFCGARRRRRGGAAATGFER